MSETLTAKEKKKVESLLKKDTLPPGMFEGLLAEAARRGIDGPWSKSAAPLPTQRQAEAARSSFAKYASLTLGFELEPWQLDMCERLQDAATGEGRRLLIHSFPQAGKTILVSQRLPAWVIGRNPDYRYRLACYNETRASKFTEIVLRLMQSPEYSVWFPDPGLQVPANSSKLDFSTLARSMKLDGQPSVLAMGLRTGFVGMGAELLVIDDPYSGQDEAFSDVINEGVWNWWTTTVMPRLNPKTNVVVMFHRWKHDDLAGKLIELGGWDYVRYPAIADGLPGDCSGLPVGQVLTPRAPMEFLNAVRRAQGERNFMSLFQGLPGPAGGDIFKSEWFKTYRIE